MNKKTAWKIIEDGACADGCEAWDNNVWTKKPCTCGFEARLIEAENWLNEHDPIPTY